MTIQTMLAPGAKEWASGQPGTGLTGRALMRAVLAPETIARVEAVEAALADPANVPTDKLYTVDGQWAASRVAIHDALLAEVARATAGVPRQRKALFMGGQPGAGKTSFLSTETAAQMGIALEDYIVVNPDEMKAALLDGGHVPAYRGLAPGETTPLIHEESSYLADMVLEQALKDGANVLIDKTMGTGRSVQKVIDLLRAEGYEVTSVFVDSSPAESLARAQYRYATGAGDYSGRYAHFAGIADTPVDDQGRSTNRVNFDEIAAPQSDRWVLVDHHRLGQPEVVATGGR